MGNSNPYVSGAEIFHIVSENKAPLASKKTAAKTFQYLLGVFPGFTLEPNESNHSGRIWNWRKACGTQQSPRTVRRDQR